MTLKTQSNKKKIKNIFFQGTFFINFSEFVFLLKVLFQLNFFL